jgi:type II secretory ATPase GspE/PulE/Tfp pilus assembly ATPase PilB-like protein
MMASTQDETKVRIASLTARMRAGATASPHGSENRGTHAPLFSGSLAEDREEAWLSVALRQRGVSEEQIRSAISLFEKDRLRNSRASFGAVVTAVGILSQMDLARLVAAHYQLPVIEHLAREAVSSEAARLLAGSVTRRCRALVIGRTGDVARVVVAEPSRRILDEVFRALASAGVCGRATTQETGQSAWLHDVFVAPASDILDKIDDVLTPKATVSEVASGRKFIESIVRRAVDEGASDVHFIPKEKAVEIKYRVDGRLYTAQLVSGDRKDEVISNAKMFGKLDVANPLEPLDGQAFLELGSRSYKLRLSSMPVQYGQQVVYRILDQNAAILPFAELGMNAADAQAVQEAMALPQGIIFMVGPTGSGKSTTLASLISQLDGNAFSIRTLENPVEYKLGNATQSEISDAMPFAKGLRALLRQDPDYILVGETRDLETAKIAIEAGLTGHMCFSTLHASTGCAGIVRLLDMGVEQGPMLAACHLFVAQRLVRRLCPQCRRPSEDSDELIERYKLSAGSGQHLWEPVGCPACRDGFKGRVGIYEVRKMRDFEEAVIKGGKGCDPLCRDIVEQLRLGTMQSDGLAKALQGLTTVDEVFAQIVS